MRPPNRTTSFVYVTGATWAAAILVALAAPATAQDEATLRSFFEGRRVGVKIDMPGTSDGVDVQADSSRPIDYQRYGDRLKTYGASIKTGESSIVTLVKVKRDLIEFQLRGGGFGTFGDDSSSYVHRPLVPRARFKPTDFQSVSFQQVRSGRLLRPGKHVGLDRSSPS